MEFAAGKSCPRAAVESFRMVRGFVLAEVLTKLAWTQCLTGLGLHPAALGCGLEGSFGGEKRGVLKTRGAGRPIDSLDIPAAARGDVSGLVRSSYWTTRRTYTSPTQTGLPSPDHWPWPW